MRGIVGFMSHLMLFLTLATLVTACAMFFAHKLKQRRKPDQDTSARLPKHDGPSMVQAYDPKRSKAQGSKS